MLFRWIAAPLMLLAIAAAEEAPGLVPSPPPYFSPTWTERRDLFASKMFGPQALFETAPGAVFNTARGFPKSWGRGGSGFGKRMLSGYGRFAIGEGIEIGVAAFRKEDPRYHRAGETAKFRRRVGHLLASGILTQNTSGCRTVAIGRLANIYGSWAIASRWNPPEVRSPRSVVLNASLGFVIKLGGNAFREFWPDVKKRLKK